MNVLTRLFNDELIATLGWTLLHSLWQGLAVALLLSLTLLLLRRSSPQFRYIAGLTGMAVMVLLAAATFFWIYEPAPETGNIAAYTPLPESSGGQVLLSGQTETDDASSWSVVIWKAGQYFNRHLPLLVMLWLLGVLMLTLRTIGELVFIQHLRYNRSKKASKHWQKRLRELVRRMGLHREVELRESRRIHTPMVIGIFKPVILFPLGMVTNLPPEQVESALAHELAHIRRHDYFVNLLQSFVEILFFFNPGVWWISNHIRAEREHCCDDWAVEVCGDEMTFVKMLAALEEYRVRNAGLVVALAGTRGSVLGRIQRLLQGHQSTQLPFRIFWSVLVCILFIGWGGLGWASEQSVQPAKLVENIDQKENEVPRLDTVSPERSVKTGRSSGVPSFDNSEESVGPAKERAAPEPEAQAPSSPEQPATAISPDTIPEAEKAYHKAMLLLQKEYRERILALQKQSAALNTQISEQRSKLNREENVKMSRALEIEKKVQLLQNEKELKQKELDIILNELEAEINEVEGKIQQIKQQATNEGADESLEQQYRELQQRKLELRQTINQKKLAQRREMLELDKQIQELKNLMILSQQELQLQQNQLHGKVFELQQQMETLQSQMQLLENEMQMKMLDLRLEYQMTE